MVKTDPQASAVSIHSPFIKLYFSDNLNPSSVHISDYGAIFNKPSVNGKVVTLSFAITPQEGKEYAFIIDSVRSIDGDTITGTKISFTAKNIPYDDLSADQQAALIQKQDRYPYTIDYISYPGFNELSDQGITFSQLQNIKQAIFDYSKVLKKEYWSVSLDPSSVRVVFHDQTARDPSGSSATFNVTMGNQSFSVRTEYTSIGKDTYTRLFAADGSQLFDNTQ